MLLAYLIGAASLLLARVDAWGDGLSAATSRVISSDDFAFRDAQALSGGLDLIECMCAPSWSALGTQFAGLAVLLAGLPLASVALWTARRRLPLDPGTLYLAFGVQCMNWTLSAAVGLAMLLSALFEGALWIHWFPLLIAANVATGVPAIWHWRDRLADAVGWRPAVLALR